MYQNESSLTARNRISVLATRAAQIARSEHIFTVASYTAALIAILTFLGFLGDMLDALGLRDRQQLESIPTHYHGSWVALDRFDARAVVISDNEIHLRLNHRSWPCTAEQVFAFKASVLSEWPILEVTCDHPSSMQSDSSLAALFGTTLSNSYRKKIELSWEDDEKTTLGVREVHASSTRIWFGRFQLT